MKRPHKNFVVEYKGSRRQPDKPTSIWGNLDLKSISRDLEIEEPFSTEPSRGNPLISAGDKTDAAARQLKADDEQPTTALPVKEEDIAQDSEKIVKPDVPQAARPPSAPEVKKPREPREKKESVNARSSEVTAKPEAPDTSDTAKALEGTRVKRAYSRKPKPTASLADTGPSGPRHSHAERSGVSLTFAAAADDDFAVLLHLEEENRNLRKLLAEKLRAENSYLRRRLG